MESAVKILIIDDEEGMCKLIKSILSEDDYIIDTATSASDMLEKLQPDRYSVAIVDIRMPGMGGIEFIQKASVIDPRLQFVMVTAYGSIENAVEAVRIGAFDYITKPFQGDEIQISVRKAIEHAALLEENRKLKKEIDLLHGRESLNTASPGMIEIISLADKVASSNLSVLITGESGTGKEVIARYIHSRSDRSGSPFVPVQCSLLPINLLESELFGFKKGSFTGANENRAGLFEQADNGTIFLDEIGDIGIDVQGKLLRFLQDREIRRIGDSKSISLNVRLISATNKDLEQLITDKAFREDLYFRLKVLSIHMPPLRERREDIPLLVRAFLNELNASRKSPVDIDRDCISMLMQYDWPGNVRELKNCIESASALCDYDMIRYSDITAIIGNIRTVRPAAPGNDMNNGTASTGICEDSAVKELSYKDAKARIMEKFEREYIAMMLSKNNGNISAASRDSGLDRKNFWQLLKKYGIDPEQYK